MWNQTIFFSLENHDQFNPQQSSTFQSTNQAISVQYGTGSMTGYMGYDTVSVITISLTHTVLLNKNPSGQQRKFTF